MPALIFFSLKPPPLPFYPRKRIHILWVCGLIVIAVCALLIVLFLGWKKLFGLGLIIGIVVAIVERYTKRLEKKKPVDQPVIDMMDEDQYWRMIETSLKNSHDGDSQRENLIMQLEHLDPVDIIRFRLRTDKLLYDTYTSEMWCAAYLLNGGCSDDGFEYFRLWLVSRGKDVYEAAKENPDWLVTQLDEDTEVGFFEDLWYVADYAFDQRTMNKLHEWVDESFKYNEANYPQMNFNWSEDDPESMKKICPNLYRAMQN